VKETVRVESVDALNNTITLEANPRYYLGRPKIDSIEFFIIKDKNAAVARLLGGDLDYVEHMYAPALQHKTGVGRA